LRGRGIFCGNCHTILTLVSETSVYDSVTLADRNEMNMEAWTRQFGVHPRPSLLQCVAVLLQCVAVCSNLSHIFVSHIFGVPTQSSDNRRHLVFDVPHTLNDIFTCATFRPRT